MKKDTYLCIALLLFTIHFSFSQTTLTSGDIAITGYNSDGSDQISFVFLRDVTSGTEINFTDRGWRNTNEFRSGNSNREGTIIWTLEENVSCGTHIVMTIPNNGNLNTSPNIGSFSESNNFNIRGNGDQIFIYQGDDDEPRFIYALNYNGTGWTSNATNQQTSALPADLIVGETALDIGSGDRDNGQYNCSVTNGLSLILTAVSDVNNWETTNGGGNQSLTLGQCDFSCQLCPTTVSWDGNNWSNQIGPNINITAIITGNYDTSIHGNIIACSLIINSNFTLEVGNSSFVEIQNDVINNGDIIIQSNGNFVQNNNDGQFINNSGATSIVNKVTPEKLDWFFYTFWSSPVSGITVDDVFGDRPSNARFIFNAENYLDLNGDGFDDNADDYQLVNGNDSLIPGVGYAMTENPSTFAPNTRGGASFEGTLNTGMISVPIAHNPANPAHYNFIGNPYPSAIDFEAFNAVNSEVVGGIAYLWSQATPASADNAGNNNVNLSQNDYATYTVGSGGAAGASGVIPTRFIPSGQGFFIASESAGDAIFTNEMRVASNTSNNQFFSIENKGDSSIFNSAESSNDEIFSNDSANRLWLNLTTDNGIFSQILVAFVDGATDANDGFIYDAPRIVPFGTYATLYSLIDEDDNNTKFVVQGKDSNGLNETTIINLGVETNIEASINTQYTISIAQFEGDFLSNATIFLTDNVLGITHDLSQGDYQFTSEVGTFNDRFEVHFVNETLSTEEVSTLPENELLVYELDNGDLQFRVSNNLQMEAIKIINLSGQTLYTLDAEGSENTYSLSLARNVYIAQIQLADGRVISKKILKQN